MEEQGGTGWGAWIRAGGARTRGRVGQGRTAGQSGVPRQGRAWQGVARRETGLDADSLMLLMQVRGLQSVDRMLCPTASAPAGLYTVGVCTPMWDQAWPGPQAPRMVWVRSVLGTSFVLCNLVTPPIPGHTSVNDYDS